MKTYIFIFAILFGLQTINAQKAEEKLDTIIKVEGKVQPCNVQKVTTTYVKFIVPGSDEIFTYKRSEIHKIIYKNGKWEKYNDPVMMMVDDYSWEAVWFTENPQDVEGMYSRGEETAHSAPSTRSHKAAKKNATIRMQKIAANKKGQVVLIKKRQATGGYGEYPGYFIEGEIYGIEPLDENGELQKDNNPAISGGVIM